MASMSEQPPSSHDAREHPDVATGYDRWAPQYDLQPNATRDLDARVLRAAPLRLEGTVALEVGCGTGKNTGWLAERARQVIAMDFSRGMLLEARRRTRAANVRFEQHDVRERWPVDPGSIGVVTCNLVLEHVRDLAPVFAEAARVLRPEGQLFVCELHPYRQLRGAQARFTDADSGATVLVPAFTHSTSEFVNGGLAAGLDLVELGEWSDEDASADVPPRLLSLLFRRR
jgi:malonyl-CoA O-methyltransferase